MLLVQWAFLERQFCNMMPPLRRFCSKYPSSIREDSWDFVTNWLAEPQKFIFAFFSKMKHFSQQMCGKEGILLRSCPIIVLAVDHCFSFFMRAKQNLYSHTKILRGDEWTSVLRWQLGMRFAGVPSLLNI